LPLYPGLPVLGKNGKKRNKTTKPKKWKRQKTKRTGPALFLSIFFFNLFGTINFGDLKNLATSILKKDGKDKRRKEDKGQKTKDEIDNRHKNSHKKKRTKYLGVCVCVRVHMEVSHILFI
jgi:hypothetical protein